MNEVLCEFFYSPSPLLSESPLRFVSVSCGSGIVPPLHGKPNIACSFNI